MINLINQTQLTQQLSILIKVFVSSEKNQNSKQTSTRKWFFDGALVTVSPKETKKIMGKTIMLLLFNLFQRKIIIFFYSKKQNFFDMKWGLLLGMVVYCKTNLWHQNKINLISQNDLLVGIFVDAVSGSYHLYIKGVHCLHNGYPLLPWCYPTRSHCQIR